MRAFIQTERVKLWPVRFTHLEYWMALDRWRNYLDDGIELYLRVYAFFLEEDRIPLASDTLPTL